MPRGSKDAYTDKQKRQAEHIEESYREEGVPAEQAAGRAWATVNRQDHGGKKSGSGRGKPRDTKKTGRKTVAAGGKTSASTSGARKKTSTASGSRKTSTKKKAATGRKKAATGRKKASTRARTGNATGSHDADT